MFDKPSGQPTTPGSKSTVLIDKQGREIDLDMMVGFPPPDMDYAAYHRRIPDDPALGKVKRHPDF